MHGGEGAVQAREPYARRQIFASIVTSRSPDTCQKRWSIRSRILVADVRAARRR
ncbi:MAG: hypothetical protein GX885_02850 [Methanomicrobiales archaeon]|nr:hypothetical protein [Methanomicrobiales archaeon]